MQIELTGCTCAGKSTLASAIRQACKEQGIDLLMGDDFVLRHVRLNGIRSSFARTLVLDLCSLFACLVTWPSNLEFHVFVIGFLFRLPVPLLQKLNLARSVFRKVGISEIIRRRGSRQRVVLVDEGTLHAAHNLFVHVSVETDANDLSTFARLVPLPDVAVYVAQSESVLIERAMQRGPHKRIPDCSYANIATFIKRAVDALESVEEQLVLQERMLTIDSQKNVYIDKYHQKDALTTTVLETICAAIDASLRGPDLGSHLSQDSTRPVQRPAYYCEG